MRSMVVAVVAPVAVFAVCCAGGFGLVRAEPQKVPAPVAPANVPGPNPPTSGGGPTRYTVDMLFTERSGATLASRMVQVTAGKTETVVVQQGGRTVSVEATVRPGAKVGCNRVDIVLRDRTIDSTGRFNKTVWQSGSEPCGPEPINLGPKDEINLRIAIRTRK